MSGGIATFSNLSVNLVGTSYTLVASSPAVSSSVTAPSFSVTAAASNTLIEGFETSTTYNVVGASSASAYLSTAAAHDGTYGLVDTNGNDWIYRNDSAAQVKQGESISVWLQFSGTANGRAYFGFGASAAGTLSLVAAPNTNQLILQSNAGYGYTDLADVNQTWAPNQWYRLEVDWSVGGSITGKVFASNGTTLLQTVTATNTSVTSGGIAFRAIGSNKFWDTVTESPLTSSSAQGSTGQSTAATGASTTGTSTTGPLGSGGQFTFPWLEPIAAGVSAVQDAHCVSTATAAVGATSNAGVLREASFGSMFSLEDLLLEESTLHSLAQARVAGH